MLQTARSLLKGLVAAKCGKKAQGAGAYLNDVQAEATRRCPVRSVAGWLQPEAQLAALRCASGRLHAPNQSTGFKQGTGSNSDSGRLVMGFVRLQYIRCTGGYVWGIFTVSGYGRHAGPSPFAESPDQLYGLYFL